SRIVTPEELEAAPYVLEGKDGRLVSGAGDSVYARGDAGGHDVFGIYRSSQTYVDPVTNEFLGLEARSIGQGKVSATSGDIQTLPVHRTQTKVSQNDRLLVTEHRTVNSIYFPNTPKQDIKGKMISVLNGVSQIGQ